MKKLITLFICLLLSVFVYSQITQYEDVIYLKNGSVIRGMIIEQIPDKTIKIKTADRNIFVFEFDEIEKITKEEIPQEILQKDQPQKHTLPDDFIKEHGFENTTDMFISLEFGNRIFGIHTTFGYRIIPQLFLGTGTGIDVYPNGRMLPIFFNIRSDFIKSRVNPFITVNIGHAFGWINNFSGGDWGGFMVEPGIGLRINFSKYFRLNFTISYKFQKAYFNYYIYNYYEYRREMDYDLLLFKIGFSL